MFARPGVVESRSTRMTPKPLALLAVLLVVAPRVHGQVAATGSVAGRVTDATGLGVAGVLVTAQPSPPAPASTSRTDENGLYSLGGLPAGACRLVFEFEGFRRQEHNVSIAAAFAATLDVRLELAAIPQTVKVTATLDEDRPPESIPGETVYSADAIDRLPGARSPEHAVLMTPGVTASGPGNALTMAGAFSFGNLFLLDGMVANDSTRAQARGFYSSEALQEIRVATSAIPVEYGRFQGGVVQTITRSGGNSLSLSARVHITNDHWRALTPYRGDATANRRAPTVEGSIGGPLLRKRLYFFGAAQLLHAEQVRTLSYTSGNYPYGENDRKYEAKVTWTPAKGHTVRAGFFHVNSERTNVNAGVVMDVASLADSQSPEWLAGATWTGVLNGRLLFEARYSQRSLTYSPSGATDTSLTAGTPIWDRSRSDARFNSPAGCAVCDSAEDERGNQDLTARLWTTVPTRRFGTHEIVAGVDLFRETRHTNSYQSGSGYRVRATRAIVQDGRVFPVFLPDRTTWIYWTPILQPARGNDLRTYSAFAADNWRASRRLTVRAGLRFDLASARDSIGRGAVEDAAWSPRVSAAWDVKGNGAWLVTTGLARYVSAVNATIADAASPGGRPATYVYDYLGPSVNAGVPGTPVGSREALQTLFGWFNANQGVKRTTRSTPSIPGVNISMDPAFAPLDTWELMAGVTRQLGARGFLRVEAISRRFLGFYANRRDGTTGQVVNAAGNRLDAIVVTNAAEQVSRRYHALLVQSVYRPVNRIRLQASVHARLDVGKRGRRGHVGPDDGDVDGLPGVPGSAVERADGTAGDRPAPPPARVGYGRTAAARARRAADAQCRPAGRVGRRVERGRQHQPARLRGQPRLPHAADRGPLLLQPEGRIPQPDAAGDRPVGDVGGTPARPEEGTVVRAGARGQRVQPGDGDPCEPHGAHPERQRGVPGVQPLHRHARSRRALRLRDRLREAGRPDGLPGAAGVLAFARLSLLIGVTETTTGRSKEL